MMSLSPGKKQASFCSCIVKWSPIALAAWKHQKEPASTMLLDLLAPRVLFLCRRWGWVKSPLSHSRKHALCVQCVWTHVHQRVPWCSSAFLAVLPITIKIFPWITDLWHVKHASWLVFLLQARWWCSYRNPENAAVGYLAFARWGTWFDPPDMCKIQNILKKNKYKN